MGIELLEIPTTQFSTNVKKQEQINLVFENQL
jgi:hypothetical protein